MEYETRDIAKKARRKIVRKVGEIFLGATALVGSWGCSGVLKQNSVEMGTLPQYEETVDNSNLAKIVMNRFGGSINSRIIERGISLLPESNLEVYGEEGKDLLQILFDGDQSHTIYKGTKDYEDTVVLLFDYNKDNMIPQKYSDEEMEKWEKITSKEAYAIFLDKFTLEKNPMKRSGALNDILEDKSYILSAVKRCIPNKEGMNRYYAGRLFVSEPCDIKIYANGVPYGEEENGEGAKTYRLSFRYDKHKEWTNSTSPYAAFTTCPYDEDSNGGNGDSGVGASAGSGGDTGGAGGKGGDGAGTGGAGSGSGGRSGR